MVSSDRNFLTSADTVQDKAVQKPLPGMEQLQPIDTEAIRKQTTCDLINRGLENNLFTLVACYKKMRIPVRCVLPANQNWIECIIADETGETDDDARVLLPAYTHFILGLGGSYPHGLL